MNRPIAGRDCIDDAVWNLAVWIDDHWVPRTIAAIWTHLRWIFPVCAAAVPILVAANASPDSLLAPIMAFAAIIATAAVVISATKVFDRAHPVAGETYEGCRLCARNAARTAAKAARTIDAEYAALCGARHDRSAP